MRPGYKTTEFWLSAVATLLGLLAASGAVTAGSNWERIAGLATATLASMGYSASRATVKQSAAISGE